MKLIYYSSILLFITSCGFKPLYGTANLESTNQILKEIYIVDNIDQTINTLEKKIIYQALIAELGIRSIDPRSTAIEGYKLEIREIEELDYPLDLDRDGTASEYNYTINITIALHDKDTKPPRALKNHKKKKCKDSIDDCDSTKLALGKRVLYNKSYTSSVNLNVAGNYYASQVSKRSYREILAKNIASELKNYLLVNFSKLLEENKEY